MNEEAAQANKVFEAFVGAWESDSEIHPGPDAPAIRHKGTYDYRLVAGGRWLLVDYRSDSGFEGHGVYGWDEARQGYVGIWVDSTVSAIAHSVGTWDPGASTMTWATHADTAGKTIRYREILQIGDDGTQVYRNIVPKPGGGEFEMIHITSRRRPQ